MDKLDQIKNEIGQIIKKGLENEKMSKAELARRVPCDKSSITQYINAERTPKIDVFVSICRELNIDINSALTGKYTKAQYSEMIPEDISEVLYSMVVLLKSGALIQMKDCDPDLSGKFVINPGYSFLTEFCKDVNIYVDSEYSEVDKIYLDLIRKYKQKHDELPKNPKGNEA